MISTYKHDTFEDLCRGPHVDMTSQVPADAFELMSVAGAYWRGDEHNPMLQRIYGTAWSNKKELQAYLQQLEEAKKRDHRKLGRDLEIFIFDDEVGPGLPLWLPRGGIVIEELEALGKEMERKAGYDRVKTPHLTKENLFLRSGHLPYYAESMYPPMELEGVRYYIKPMNCPFHHKIFAAKTRSYRDLPVRLAEYGTCYRYEKSGELFGLMRVRSMQMNDAHIYCSEEQFEQEFMGVIDLYQKYFDLFGIEKYVMRFSTHDKKGLGKKYVDNERLWLKTEDMVRRAMLNGGVPFVEVAGRSRLLRPQDRRADLERNRARVLAGHEPGRLRGPGALRPEVHEQRGQGRNASLHPPRSPRHARAHGRLPARALRGQLPGVALARPGARCARRRSPQRIRSPHSRRA